MNANVAKAYLTHPLQDRGVRLRDRGVDFVALGDLTTPRRWLPAAHPNN
jgi:hypothetical protein